MSHLRAARAMLAILLTGSLVTTAIPGAAAPGMAAGARAAVQVPDRSKAYGAARAKGSWSDG